MERQMQELVDGYFCEWTEILKDPERQKAFRQFDNTDEEVEGVEIVTERQQQRPAYWASEAAEQDFKGHQWSELAWQPLIQVGHFDEFPTAQQMCPHKRAFILSDGIIGEGDGKYWVSCPHHKRNFELNGSEAGKCSNDESMNIATFPVEEREDGWIYVKLPPVPELDALLGTSRWKTKSSESCNPFERMDQKLEGCKKGRRARKPQDVPRKVVTTNSISW
ncbi:unnamed protein product [Parascedosporium putredinis]|uniref:Rieske domain-containing protein n=1 Tax=Parascedosporium putredinis TaxID=1442378 RepID=A0A9P1H3W0_9PEZI|nr:unnamed protein product [Parascedosporium putredinis]CAI7996171.1 unnamed protein product [Parascedosporium putredinis]